MKIDVRRAIEVLVPDAKWDFSIANDGGEEDQYGEIRWFDERPKPDWSELVSVASGFSAADLLARRQSAVIGPMALEERLTALGIFDTVNAWANAQGGRIAWAWNRATEFERMHPLITDAQLALELTDEQVDELFGITP